ncbi:MAG: carboxymuconolactone decarboxylase family protein [Proteobacteria bacterium]|nr:carboxymuconolactone decarboxylase family protein [Burkholderiales bacterium]
MARVSLIEEHEHPELAAEIGTIRGGRRGTLSMIYRLMLHSPAAAMAWYEQNSALRWETKLDGFVRELVILRVAVVTRCEYVRRVHAGVYAEEEGFSPEQIAAIGVPEARWSDVDDDIDRARDGVAGVGADAAGRGTLGIAATSASRAFDARSRAALAYIDAMTRDVHVPDTVFAALRTHFDERQIVELTMLVGAYNMLTRVLQALDADFEPLPPKKG